MSDFKPTGRLRYMRRTVQPNAAVDHAHTVTVLQQEFCCASMARPLGNVSYRYEWRDVPMEDE